MQHVLPILCLAAVLASAARGAPAAAPTQARRPNFIVILADDLGYGDLSCYGQKRFQTPHLDRLASEGVRFTRHYAGSSVCAPSRCVLLTGLHTGHAEIRGNREILPEGQQPMSAGTAALPKLLQKIGYATAAFGKWGLGPPGSEGDPSKQGFDHFFGYNCQRLDHSDYPDHLWEDGQRVNLPENDHGKRAVYAPELIQRKALDFIARHRDRPFFLYLASPLPHAEMDAPAAYLAHHRGKYGRETPFRGVDDGPQFRKGPYASQPEPKAAYAGMIELLDHQVGQVIKLIGDLGLTENTFIVFTSDNGAAAEGGISVSDFNSTAGLRGFKRDLYEGGIRVPMIASWPGRIPKGGVSDFVSAFWDFFPTFAELAGAPVPPGLDGVSLVPVLTGRGAQKPHDYLYWEFHEAGGRMAIRQGDWKGVRYDVLLKPDGPLELYNLADDPAETSDVAARFPERAAALDALMRRARTESPIFRFGDKGYLQAR